MKATEKYLFKNRRKFVQIPSWNAICKRKYECARESFWGGLPWLNNGKIRQGELYDEMVNSRKIFIKALRCCKFNNERISNDILASSFKHPVDDQAAWSNVWRKSIWSNIWPFRSYFDAWLKRWLCLIKILIDSSSSRDVWPSRDNLIKHCVRQSPATMEGGLEIGWKNTFCFFIYI